MAKLEFDWPSLPNLNPPFGPGISNQKTWDDVIYRVAGRYEFSDDLMAYVSYSTGKKAGGFSASATTLSQLSPYSPESAKALEGGVKSEWLDHRLRVNVTLATGIPEQVCRAVNLGYRDPATIDVAAFAADPDTLVVPRAGEVLFRLR